MDEYIKIALCLPCRTMHSTWAPCPVRTTKSMSEKRVFCRIPWTGKRAFAKFFSACLSSIEKNPRLAS